MRGLLAAAVLLLCPGISAAQEPATGVRPGPPGLPTPGELRGWFAPTSPAETGAFLANLERAYAGVSADTLLLVAGDPVQPDSSLPVHLVTIRRPDYAADRTERGGEPEPRPVRVLVLAAQRGDDLAGLEVSLRMMRDLAAGAFPEILERVDVKFVPAVNPWGLLWWVREEPSGVDPSLDHAALRTPAIRAVHELVGAWEPDMVVDLRDLGQAVYRVQVGLPMHPNADPELTRYGRFYLLPYVANELARASVTFRENIAAHPEAASRDPLVGGAEALPPGAFLTPGPLGADRARNSFALGGSLALMLGVAAVDGPEGLGGRVELQYQALRALLEVTAGQGAGLQERTTTARARSGGELALRFGHARDENSPELTWLVWSERGTVVRQTTDRWRSAVQRELVLPVPAAWVIEADSPEWADLVRAHGFAAERLSEDARLRVTGYPVSPPDGLPGLRGERDPRAADAGADIDEAVDATALLQRGERELPAGSWVVRSDQPRARLLFTLLEPWSQDAPLAARSDDTGPLHPVFRIDAETLSRLRTEPADDAPGRDEASTAPGTGRE